MNNKDIKTILNLDISNELKIRFIKDILDEGSNKVIDTSHRRQTNLRSGIEKRKEKEKIKSTFCCNDGTLIACGCGKCPWYRGR
jgi:hypothetical protein